MSIHQEHTYVPAVAIMRATRRHSLQKVPVVMNTTPRQVCGDARRIGYTGTQDSDLALYRIKIRPGNGQPTMTLPAFYILEGGVFREYEQP
ncbi:MAG TPA: hypothetical protein VKX46_21345 [Ktedonobacteraceae bacterium]|nr:hypothetical protein [Ktedonobacteraceae bacterium]